MPLPSSLTTILNWPRESRSSEPLTRFHCFARSPCCRASAARCGGSGSSASSTVSSEPWKMHAPCCSISATTRKSLTRCAAPCAPCAAPGAGCGSSMSAQKAARSCSELPPTVDRSLSLRRKSTRRWSTATFDSGSSATTSRAVATRSAYDSRSTAPRSASFTSCSTSGCGRWRTYAASAAAASRRRRARAARPTATARRRGRRAGR